MSKLKVMDGTYRPFTAEEYMMLYTMVFNMCVQRPPYDCSEQLYIKYRKIGEECLERCEKYIMPTNQGDESILLYIKWSRHAGTGPC